MMIRWEQLRKILIVLVSGSLVDDNDLRLKKARVVICLMFRIIKVSETVKPFET